MALRIIDADARLAEAKGKTTMVMAGSPGVGKTRSVKTIKPAEQVLFIDLEAGMKSIQDWPGDSIPVRSFVDAVNLACLIGGPDPAAASDVFYSQAHYDHLAAQHPELVATIAQKRVIFVDSITDLTRLAMVWAKTQAEAFSAKTGAPDTRGAYGLLAREVIALLKHLQHAPGKTVIFVGILEKVTDDVGRATWQLQMEGGKAARELPGIVDQVLTLGLFRRDPDGALHHDPETGTIRALVCTTGNPYGLPAKDRSGRLDALEPPDLGALLSKINAPKT